MDLTFSNIMSHINTIYVLKNKDGFIKPRVEIKDETPIIRIKVRKLTLYIDPICMHHVKTQHIISLKNNLTTVQR